MSTRAMTFVVYRKVNRNFDERWLWRIDATNGRTIAVSASEYRRKGMAIRAAERAIEGFAGLKPSLRAENGHRVERRVRR